MRKWYKVSFLSIFLLTGCINTIQNTDYLLSEVSVKKTGINFKNVLTEDANHSIINYIYYYNGGGVSTGDINNDGLPDLYFVSNQGKNRLYINKGNLQFEDITEKANVSGSSSWNTGSTMIDINNDGYLDIYVCAVSVAALEVLTSIFGDNFSFEDTTEIPYNLPMRKFKSFRLAAQEATISRLYGGIHYVSAVQIGLNQGINIGNHVIFDLSFHKEE